MPYQIAKPPLRFGPARQNGRLIHQDRERIGNRTVFDDELAFHVDLAERELGVKQNSAFGVGGQEAGEDVRPGGIAAGEFFSAGGGESYRAAANELLKEVTQQTVHRNHQPAIPQNQNRFATFDARGTKWFLHRIEDIGGRNRYANALYTKQISLERTSMWLRHTCASIRGI